jgi:PAS domain S-box-containing protein
MPAKKKSIKPADRSIKELQQSELRFRTMFDTAAVGIGMMGFDRKLMDANPALCRMFGMSREELIGQTPVVVTHPDDYQNSSQQFSDLISGKQEYYWGERRYKRKNGETFWANVTMSVVRDDDGKPLYIIGMLVDVNEQKKALGRLQESEARLRAIYENASIGIALVSMDGHPLAVNPAILAMTGYTEQEFMARSGLELGHPDDLDAAAARMRDIIEGRIDAFETESRFFQKNGRTFWVRQTISSVRGKDGRPAYLVIMVANIDEQKRILAESVESEARFRAMFEYASLGIVIGDVDRRPIAVNRTMADMLGYSQEELLQLQSLDVTYPEDKALGKREFMQLKEGSISSYQLEKRLVRKTGDPFWVRQTVSSVRDPSGKMVYWVSMVENIDSQKHTSVELQESEARFRAMFDNAAVGISLISPERRPQAVNAALVKMSGFSEQELLNLTGQDITHTDDQKIGMVEFKELLEGTRDAYTIEKRYIRKGGQVYWTRLSISAVRDEQGKLLNVITITEDIDEQKRALEHLRESEARFRAMYDNAAVGMAMMSLDRKIISINQVAEKMTGYTPDELYNSDPSRLSHPDDVQIGIEQFKDMVAGKIPGFQMEKRFIRKSGETFWGRVTYSVVPDQQDIPEYLVGIIEDVTNEIVSREKLASQEAEYRRTLEQRVEERTYELADANLRLMDEIEQRKRVEEALASKAAEDAVTAERTRLARELHDAVTQTLFASSLIAEVLPDLWNMDVDEAKKSTEELRQLTRGALAEMRTLLLELRPAALTQSKLGDLIRQLCEAFIGRSRLPINLTVEGDRSLPPEVQVAYYRIAQESLNNVFKYARASRVNVSLYSTPVGVHLDICDNGIGFDMSNLKPTSLGMRIMRERAEAVGAQLSISSEPGKGVCIDLDWVEKPDMKLSVFKRD